ncbi:shikimate dehydrogenase family protein [Gardnerella sp. DNF00497B]|uniref:shikimate dehydrogenase family protein n=1 Tax=Gardnerella sp. DNF00497B TaxID=2749048 RepID=UPI003BB1B970
MVKIYHCAVLGDPILHSLSPVLHNTAYKALGLTNWQYSKEKVSETDLHDFITHLDDSWKGLSLTMPLKKTVMKLGTPCDYWSRTLNVANTAVFTSNPAVASQSQIKLYNTDVSGILITFMQALHERICEVKKAVIIGSGNTASSALAALIEIAQVAKLEQVQVVARTEDDGSVKGVERFNNLIQKYCADFPNKISIGQNNKSEENDAMYEPVQGIEFPTISEEVFSKFADYSTEKLSAEKLSECDKSLILRSLNSLEAVRAIAEADIVVSTVPAHVADPIALALKAYCQDSAHNQTKLGTLLDVVYDPRPSMLLSVWQQYGCAIGGEEMLLQQALAQVSLMTIDYRQSKENFEDCAETGAEDCAETGSELGYKPSADKARYYDDLSSLMRKALQEAL